MPLKLVFLRPQSCSRLKPYYSSTITTVKVLKHQIEPPSQGHLETTKHDAVRTCENVCQQIMESPEVESPQMWVRPQLVFAGSSPSPIAIGGPFPQAKSPSLPALSLPLPPTPLDSFCDAPGRGGPVWCGGRGPRVQGGGGVEGRALQQYLGPDPHLGVLDEDNPLVNVNSPALIL